MSNGSLEARADELTKSVKSLAAAADALAARERRTRKIVVLTIAGLVLDVLLSIILGFLIRDSQQADDQINANARSIERIQDRTSNEVLCPLYTLFAAALVKPPPPDSTPEQIQQYNQFRDVINHGLDTLDCR